MHRNFISFILFAPPSTISQWYFTYIYKCCPIILRQSPAARCHCDTMTFCIIWVLHFEIELETSAKQQQKKLVCDGWTNSHQHTNIIIIIFVCNGRPTSSQIKTFSTSSCIVNFVGSTRCAQINWPRKTIQLTCVTKLQFVIRRATRTWC